VQIFFPDTSMSSEFVNGSSTSGMQNTHFVHESISPNTSVANPKGLSSRGVIGGNGKSPLGG